MMGLLHLIHAHVGGGEQFGLGIALGPDLDPEADRDVNVSRARGYRAVRDRRPQTLIQDARAVLPAVLREDHELIPAMATQDVVPSQIAPDEVDEAAQNIVSGLMTVRVVDLLEMVDVTDSDGQEDLACNSTRRRPTSTRASSSPGSKGLAR